MQKPTISLMLAGGLVVLAGWAAYSNSFHGPFIFDDENAILNNATIRQLWPIGPVLSPPCHGETVSSRPILNLSFAVNYAVSGTKVWGYHATNLVIHLFNALLLLGILRRTFLLPTLRQKFGHTALPLASAITLLWVVHPLTTEAVTYLVQRAESLAAMFYLLVLYAVIRGSQSERPLLWYVMAVVTCWLGVASKEVVATAPVVVLFYDRAFLANSFRQAWQQRWKLYLGLATAWLMMAALMVALGGRSESAGFGHGVTSWEYAASQGGAILRYVRLALWPTGLCLDYGRRQTSVDFFSAQILLGTLLVLVLLGLTGWTWKHWPKLGFLGVFFFIVLAPSSSFVPIVVQTTAEHRMYLPLAAIIMLLVVGIYRAGQKWIARGRLAIGLGLMIGIAAMLGILTFQRNQNYSSELSIWKDTAIKASNNFAAHNSWGLALMHLNQPLEAIPHFERAVQLHPHDAAAIQNNWGSALAALNRSTEAIEHFQQAAKINPHDAMVQYNWGTALRNMGRLEESIEHYQQAVRIEPKFSQAYHYWGISLFLLNRLPEAVAKYEQALALNSNDTEIRFNLYRALAKMGRIREAIEQGREVARQMPDNARVIQGVAWLLATHDPVEGGNGPEAVKLALRACELTQQKNFVCLDTLAATYASVGEFDAAITTAKAAWQLAQAVGQNSAAEEILRRLQFYRDRKPYREPAARSQN